MEKFGIRVPDPNQAVGTLSGGQRQCLAIARAVYFGAKILILDEPTAALGVKQSANVLKMILRVRSRGIGIIFITHNVQHATLVGDNFSVLNRGRTLCHHEKSEISADELYNKMAGGAEMTDLENRPEKSGSIADLRRAGFGVKLSRRRLPMKKLRSSRWFAPDDLRSFGHRSRAKQMGWSGGDFGKPVIAIVSTWSDLNTCHTHFPERIADIKRGIAEAGGVPAELPAMSLGEQLMKPSAMMYRNLLAMQTEEMLRSYPVDGAVLMGGCDKTTPGVLMGAISANLPCIYVPAGAMTRGHFRGETLGSGTDVWKYWELRRAGKISKKAWLQIEDGIARAPGVLHDNGHRRHDDDCRRGAGFFAARRGVHSGGGFGASAHGAGVRRAGGRAGAGEFSPRRFFAGGVV